MLNTRAAKNILYFNLSLNISVLYIVLMFFIQVKKVFLEFFDSFENHILNENVSLINISDYYNLYPVITSDKKIYTGIPPIQRSNTTSKIINISSAVTYNEKYILMSCTKDYLLTIINIETGEEKPLVPYGEFKVPDSICSISTKNNDVYIGISHIIVPSYNVTNNISEDKNDNNNYTVLNSTDEYFSDLNLFSNLTEVNTEDNYSEYNNTYDTYFQNTIIKIKLKINEDDGQILDDFFNISKYLIEYKYKVLNISNNISEYENQGFNTTAFPRPFSCEIINIEDTVVPRLVCEYTIKNNKGYKNFTYLLVVMDSNFDVENQNEIGIFPNLVYIKLQRIDSNSLRCIISDKSFQITLKNNNSICVITKQETQSFKSPSNLFFYNNQYYFSANPSLMFIKNNISKNYYSISCNEKMITQIIGYYKEDQDKLIFIYQSSLNKIKYFTMENIIPFFKLKSKRKIFEVKSNTSIEFNVSNLFENPNKYIILSLHHLLYFQTIGDFRKEYDKYNFNKETQLLTIEPSLNDWINFTFYIVEKIDEALISFFPENSMVSIRTCLFKCGICSNSYDECDEGTCKEGFALFENNFTKGCYPINQNYPNYIYTKDNSNLFQKCYYKCKFCSEIGKLSSNNSQNCKICEDGYLRSYKFPGNCYKIEEQNNLANSPKIVTNRDDENFEIVNSCFELNKSMIYDTGECIDSCPKNSYYYYFDFNNSFNILEQQENYMGLLYPLYIKSTPKFYFNKICYSTCPEFTYKDYNKYECICSYGWYYNSSIDEKICYAHDYCLSLEFFYHTDNKECVLNGCMEGYYRINFECYKGECPSNTRDISTDIKKCESNLKYCIINKHYRTKCSNTPFIGYNLKYNDKNTYFKFCNESLYYFNVKTYLYRNICYEYCPEETIKNDTNDRCSCIYYIYYVNEGKTDYECLKEKEKCWDNKRYNITDIKECVNTAQECVDLGYKVFNYDCLNKCPENSELKTEEEKNANAGICLCKYNYYNDSGFLTCFENEEKCENKNFPFKMENTNECFSTTDECTKKNFKLFNNICYENSCPTNTIEKYDNGICLCSYYYFNNSDKLECFDEEITCETHTPSYPYTNLNTKECFKSKEDCINRGYKIFNKYCYNECPKHSEEKNNDNICLCSVYSLNDENNLLKCFQSEIECVSENYYFDKNTKECFLSEKICIQNDKKIFGKECVDKCPKNSLLNKENSNICECSYYFYYNNGILYCLDKNKTCESISYYTSNDINNKECIYEMDKSDICNSIDYITGICRIKNNGIDEIIKNFQKDILSGTLEKLLISLGNDEIEDIMVEARNILLTITTSENQKNKVYDNKSTIKLGKCEEKLRTHYNLTNNESLFIFKIDYFEKGLLIPVINYEIYNLELKQKLDLNICKDTQIVILIPVSINEDKLFLYNSSSEFYNDICYSYSTENKTDIIINDRRNKYITENYSLCENNCEYKGYDRVSKNAICKCNIKIKLKYFSEIVIDKNKLINNFKNFNSILNLKVLKCYKLLFTKNGFKYNIGNYRSLIKKIRKLVRYIKNSETKDNNNINKCNMKENKKFIKEGLNNIKIPHENKKRKIKIIKTKKKINKCINIMKTDKDSKNSYDKLKINENMINSNDIIQNNNIPPLKVNETTKNSKNKIVKYKYNDYEMNSLCYEDSIEIDKRSYSQYYLSLLRIKHPLIFSFYTYNDYNSKIIKICLFIFYFSLYFAVNALFFSDSTMHKIYEDEGSFNFIYQIPIILYSFLISNTINYLLKYLSLSEKAILNLKNCKIKKIRKYKRQLKKCLFIKYIIFFIISFILLLLFWYYISCFCVVFKNTQILLIKDTLISYGFSLLYPFGINLLPGFFRIRSLKSVKKDKKWLYRISKYLQSI